MTAIFLEDSSGETVLVSLTDYVIPRSRVGLKEWAIDAIDSYGRVFYNAHQMRALIEEIDLLVVGEDGPVLAGLLALREMCNQGLDRAGSYLKVVGN